MCSSFQNEKLFSSGFFPPSPHYNTPFNQWQAILFPSVMFNEHTVHSFIAGDGREEGREVGSVIVTQKKNKNNEK